jgi:hypothetical protein
VPLCSETGDFKFPITVGLMSGFELAGNGVRINGCTLGQHDLFACTITVVHCLDSED